MSVPPQLLPVCETLKRTHDTAQGLDDAIYGLGPNGAEYGKPNNEVRALAGTEGSPMTCLGFRDGYCYSDLGQSRVQRGGVSIEQSHKTLTALIAADKQGEDLVSVAPNVYVKQDYQLGGASNDPLPSSVKIFVGVTLGLVVIGLLVWLIKHKRGKKM